MKTVVVHGEDSVGSRKRFASIVKGIKKRNWNVSFLDPKEAVADKLSNKTLYENETLYVIEEAKKLSVTDIEWISKNSSGFSFQLLIYSKGKIPITLIRKLPKTSKIEEFSVPRNIFKFLDSLTPRNSANSIKLFKELEKEPNELVIASMGKLFRDLYWVKTGAGPDYPSWRKAKLERQSERFEKSLLKEIIEKLAEIDLISKTSDTNPRLLVEMLILEKL